MPNLGDYIGQLLAEITTARMRADMEAVRVAELYASHPLLKTMPVPRFRLPEITLDVPVGIKNIEEQGEEIEVDPVEQKKAFDASVAESLEYAGIKPTPQVMKKLDTAIKRKIATMRQPQLPRSGVFYKADALSKTAAKIIMEAQRDEEGKSKAKIFEIRSKKVTRREFLKLEPIRSKVEVLVTSQELREAGPEDTILRIQLKVTEESVEWTSIESDGETKELLTPE